MGIKIPTCPDTYTGEQKTDLYEHGGILEGGHEVKVGSLSVDRTETTLK
jgi:hypothetical protein